MNNWWITLNVRSWQKESIPTLKSEVLLIRTKCKSAAWKTKYALSVFSQVLLIKWTRLTDHCYGPWPWGKWAGLPVRKSKCARTQMIGWLGTRAHPTACSSECASPYQSLAAWGSAALRGLMTRLPAFTCDYKKAEDSSLMGHYVFGLNVQVVPHTYVFEPHLPDSGSAWIALKCVSARVANFHLCLSLWELFCIV